MDDLFDIKDMLLNDTESSNGVNRIVWLVVRIVMAITTFGFFANYAAGLTTWAVGSELAPYVSGALGVFLIDILAYRWNAARLSATTMTQIHSATWAMYMDLILSTGTTVIFVSFSTEFLTPSGNLLYALNLIGLAVGIIAFVGNFLFVAAYQAQEAGVKTAVQGAEIRAMAYKGQHEIDKALTTEVVARTIKEAQQRIPSHSDREALLKTDAYLRNMATAETDEETAEGRRTLRPFTRNGREPQRK